jgi:hypothetical protein
MDRAWVPQSGPSPSSERAAWTDTAYVGATLDLAVSKTAREVEQGRTGNVTGSGAHRTEPIEPVRQGELRIPDARRSKRHIACDKTGLSVSDPAELEISFHADEPSRRDPPVVTSLDAAKPTIRMGSSSGGYQREVSQHAMARRCCRIYSLSVTAVGANIIAGPCVWHWSGHRRRRLCGHIRGKGRTSREQ